jgi:hypothetical protein
MLTKAKPSSDDPPAAIAGGMHELREENATLRHHNDELEDRCYVLQLEITSLKVQIDNERTKRQHYHSLANEFMTRLDVIGRTIDDVVQRAQQREFDSTCKELPGAKVTELRIPADLNQPLISYPCAEPMAGD